MKRQAEYLHFFITLCHRSLFFYATKFLIVIDDPHAIQGRLKKRDKHDYGLKVLKKMQDAEMSHAKTIGKKFGIEIQCIHMIDSKHFLMSLKDNSLN